MITAERDEATGARDAAIAAEANIRVQASERGRRFRNAVGFLRGAVTTLGETEALLDVAIERENAAVN